MVGTEGEVDRHKKGITKGGGQPADMTGIAKGNQQGREKEGRSQNVRKNEKISEATARSEKGKQYIKGYGSKDASVRANTGKKVKATRPST